MINFEIALYQHTLKIIQQKRMRVLVYFSYWVEGKICYAGGLHFEHCARSPLVSVLTASESHVFSAGITEGMFCWIIRFGQIAALIFSPLTVGNSFNCFPFEFLSISQESASIGICNVIPSERVGYEKSLSSSNTLFLC